LTFKKIADMMSQGLGRSASHISVQGSSSNTNSPRQNMKRSISEWIMGQLKNKESEGKAVQKIREMEVQQRVMSPNAERRLREQVYGFKRQKRDMEVDLPILSGFFPFLANVLM
jgi:hypothetical protein